MTLRHLLSKLRSAPWVTEGNAACSDGRTGVGSGFGQVGLMGADCLSMASDYLPTQGYSQVAMAYGKGQAEGGLAGRVAVRGPGLVL